jgi:hypothetical protein
MGCNRSPRAAGDIDLALVDGARKLGLGAVANNRGILHEASAHIEHRGGFILGRCANLRILTIRPNPMRQRGEPRRHGPLALIEVAPRPKASPRSPEAAHAFATILALPATPAGP